MGCGMRGGGGGTGVVVRGGSGGGGGGARGEGEGGHNDTLSPPEQTAFRWTEV